MLVTDKAVTTFRRQIEFDMLANLRLIGDAARGKPVPRDLLADAERRFADCKAILFNA